MISNQQWERAILTARQQLAECSVAHQDGADMEPTTHEAIRIARELYEFMLRFRGQEESGRVE